MSIEDVCRRIIFN